MDEEQAENRAGSRQVHRGDDFIQRGFHGRVPIRFLPVRRFHVTVSSGFVRVPDFTATKD
jgi:hypothetical protein